MAPPGMKGFKIICRCQNLIFYQHAHCTFTCTNSTTILSGRRSLKGRTWNMKHGTWMEGTPRKGGME